MVGGLVAGAIQEDQLTMETVVGSPAAAVAGTAVSVAARTGCPTIDLQVGCGVPLTEGGWPKDTTWVICSMVRRWETVPGAIKVTSGGSLRGVQEEGTTRGTRSRGQDDGWVENATGSCESGILGGH